MSIQTRMLRRLPADRGGAVSPLAAFAIVALVGFVGIATDTARGYFVRARLAQALDAAALAGGRVFFEDTRDADIQKYFSANFPDGYMDATLTPIDIQTSKDAGGDRLDLSASATLPTTFMRIAGINSITVSASNQVTRQTAYLDVVLSIDLSTSMNQSAGSTTRIAAARTAANTLVNILYGEDETKDLLKIALVPWTAKVNITNNGQSFTSYTQPTVTSFKNPAKAGSPSQTKLYYANNAPGIPLLSAPTSAWKGCVYARVYWDQRTNSSHAGHADTIMGENSGSWGAWKGFEPVLSEGEVVSGSSECNAPFYDNGNTECTPCYNRGITRLTNVKSTITQAINQLTVLSSEQNSYTNLPQGLYWAWHVITPEAPFSEADANPQGKRIQAIVFLTDGENYRQYGDAYKRVFSESTLNTRAQTIANNIKAGGIKIYAIQFGDAPTLTQQNLMKGIASDPDDTYYKYAPDAAALEAVFTEVANGLSELRLSK
ncbi:MAG: VWA domain-containing protein [Rhodospirillales bacterium]